MIVVAGEKIDQAIEALRVGLDESRARQQRGDHEGAGAVFLAALQKAEEYLLSALLWMDEDENTPVTVVAGTGA